MGGGRKRIESIDLVRGAVMVVMLLDHARDFVHRDALLYDPTDLSQTSPALFLTRWVTHFCSPVFVFLAGTSARLREARGAAKRDLSRYLAVRGAGLIALELLVLRPLIWFNLDPSLLAHLQVIWAIGWSMLSLALLVHLPLGAIAALSLAVIAGHDALDRFQVATPATSLGAALWMVLHQSGPVIADSERGWGVFVHYPLVPWFAVMAAGYAFGALYELEPARRRRALAAIGAATVLAFVALRAANVYGDPQPWSGQQSAGYTLLSFLNTSKYPPSLLFLLMTLGPAILALAALDSRSFGKLTRPLLVLGGVPLFFYVLQWPAVHLTSRLFQWLAGQPTGWDAVLTWKLPSPLPSGIGFSLATVYLAWALDLALLYPQCAWYARFRRRKRAS